tara:strand:+ start:252 stop:455 length:204 start_codon:yes stop_codon:yes gene_type:complete
MPTHLIKELYQKKLLDQHHQNVFVDLNNYFKYSGKIEYKKRFIEPLPPKANPKTIINNDMSKYKFKK